MCVQDTWQMLRYGASVMTGVVARVKAAEPRALFTHCYGHALNLACEDTFRQCKQLH